MTDNHHEANLAFVTDDEWLDAHARLVEENEGPIPPAELTFVWDLQLEPASLIDEDEIEVAPRG